MTEQTLAGLAFERPGYAASDDLAARRAALARAVTAGVWRTKRAPVRETLAGVRVLRFQPMGAALGRVLHLHGGAFRIGCPEMMGPFAEALANECNVEVVLPAYRLAPEHPFPAALRDAYAAMSALRRENSSPLVVSGDSAGGGLAASLTLLSGAAPIAGLALLSPWLDLTASNASFQLNAATDALFSLAAAQEAAELYLQGLSPREPLASPALATIAAFPPTLINVGAGEVLVDDSRTFDRALREAGIASTLHEVEEMEHVAVTRSLSLPGAAETFAALTGFVSAQI